LSSSREFVESFRRLCHEHGLAFTHQRQIIYGAVLSARDHPTPEAIYDRVRRQIPSISLGTVYKNINIFLEAGLLQQVSLHHGSLRVDANTHAHHHLVCKMCRTIIDLEERDLEPARLRAKLPKGFHVERQNVEIIGVCESCAGK
jgi:Fur family transcriptional regulator, peroxide stress response regulator